VAVALLSTWAANPPAKLAALSGLIAWICGSELLLEAAKRPFSYRTACVVRLELERVFEQSSALWANYVS
jgi:hypothetical protein